MLYYDTPERVNLLYQAHLSVEGMFKYMELHTMFSEIPMSLTDELNHWSDGMN